MKFQEPGHYTKADRDKMPAENFAGPHKSFPIMNQKDVEDAARLAGQAKDPEHVKRRIAAIAKRMGLKLPKSYKRPE